MSLQHCCAECDKPIYTTRRAPCGQRLCNECCSECQTENYGGECPDMRRANREKNENRMKKIFALLAVLLMLLAGCAVAKSGEVVDKHFTPAHYEDRTRGHFVGKVYYTTHYQVYVDDRWTVTVEGCPEGQDKKVRTEWYVTQTKYDAVKIGDWFNAEDDAK